MIWKNILFFLTILTIIGCDVPGKIEICNNINKVVVVSYSYKDKIENQKSKTYQINPNEKKVIMLGFGTKWNESFMKYYSNEIIDTISIKIGDEEYLCFDKKCKDKVFNRTNRKSNTTMKIIINSNLIEALFIKK